MAKIDFNNILVKDIEERDLKLSIKKDLGNLLYMHGQNIEECELGRKIYYAEGTIELNQEETEIVLNSISGYSYIVRTAIEEILNKQ